MSAGFFRGTNADQDSRFGNADKKMMSKMNFDKVLSTKVSYLAEGPWLSNIVLVWLAHIRDKASSTQIIAGIAHQVWS